jgi:hypothetical protein
MATLWMYRAWAVCSLAYWSVRSLPARPTGPIPRHLIARVNRLRVAVGVVGLVASAGFIVMTGGQSYSHIEGFASTTTLDQFIHHLRQLSKIYIFLYFYARARGGLLEREHWLLYAILSIYALIFIASAAKVVAIELIAMWVLGNAAGGHRGKIARELILAAIALTLTYFIFLWVTAYRQELFVLVTHPAASFSEALDRQIQAATLATERVVSGQQIGSLDNPYDSNSMLARLALVMSFATVLDLTGGMSPYQHAWQSFLTPLYAILPRNMFEDKVQFLDSAELAQMLGWKFGGFSVGLPASLFWAWGFEGMLPAIAVLGVVIAVLARRGEQDDLTGLFSKVLLMSMMISLLDVGIQFQPIIISLVRVAAFFAVLNVVVARLFPGGSGNGVGCQKNALTGSRSPAGSTVARRG